MEVLAKSNQHFCAIDIIIVLNETVMKDIQHSISSCPNIIKNNHNCIVKHQTDIFNVDIRVSASLFKRSSDIASTYVLRVEKRRIDYSKSQGSIFLSSSTKISSIRVIYPVYINKRTYLS